jgi:hypothetical protein
VMQVLQKIVVRVKQLIKEDAFKEFLQTGSDKLFLSEEVQTANTTPCLSCVNYLSCCLHSSSL